MSPEARKAIRQERSKPLVVTYEAWLREQRALLSSKSEIAKAINYTLDRWTAFTRFLDDGRICLSKALVHGYGRGGILMGVFRRGVSTPIGTGVTD
jgi:transposase